MTVRTWSGSNGNFKTANNWSPPGTPMSGDTAIITNGSVNINKFDLTGIDVEVTSTDQNNPTTLTLHNSTIDFFAVTTPASNDFPIADMTIRGTVTEEGTLMLGAVNQFNGGSTLNMDIKNGSNFINKGSINEESFSHLNISGKGAFDNNGTWDAVGSQSTVSTPIDGIGTINVELGINEVGSKLTVGNSVSANQTVNLIGNAQLQLDDTPQFLAQITMANVTGSGLLEEVILSGITSTSASYNGSILDVFNGSNLVASLRITSAHDMGFTVNSSGGNTFITPDGPVMAPIAHALVG